MKFNIYNEKGDLVIYTLFEKTEQGRYLLKLDVSQLQNGFYYIECRTETASEREKLIIIK